jgi:Fe-coproporphyrin III synthase
MAKRTLYGTVIVTYRCNAHCNMCDCFKDPTKPSEEITLDNIKKLPEMAFTNITGGEPFIRKDIPEIVEELYKKSDRIVISTNGYFTDPIIDLCKRFPKVGIRISIEGLEATNNAIRGLPDGFNRGYTTLKTLVEMGHPDVGFGMTVQDMNCEDLVPLYKLSDELGMEFATATLHNSFYFRKTDNKINDKYHVAQCFEALNNELLNSKSPKKWFRAYFNHGLINYIYGNKRLLPCDMSSNAFFIDPFCDVIPCNGMAKKAVMGNLREAKDWKELWTSKQADEVRKCTKKCDRNCWMIGSASPAMHKYIWVPGWWVVKHKLLKGGKYSLSENKFIPEIQKRRE